MTDLLPTLALPADLQSGARTCVDIHNSKTRGRITVFRKPATPDPFVNAQLTSLGNDANGRERFFISCLSGETGAASFLLTENGESRIYEWPGHHYVYSVTMESPDVLWLGGSSAFSRLDLATGQQETHRIPEMGFITAGMALDAETGKLLGGAQFSLVSFDTRERKTIRIYKGEAERSPDKFHYDHWRLPDGSYGFILNTPGLSFLRWDPKKEVVTWRRLSDDSRHPAIQLLRWLKYEDKGRIYLPHFGWLDGTSGTITPHERPPAQEACWLGRRGDTVYGVQGDGLNALATVVAWDLASGKIHPLFSIPDTGASGCALTRAGKLLSVDIYGNLRRHDLATGALELTRTLESEHEHRCNVILPAGNNRVIGTPFISMNFWGFDTKQGKGYYGGRAAGSYGQCDNAVQVGGKVYFAIYGGGQLTEYDPDKQTGFPRNPRVVALNAQGQHGAGITTDGRVVWVALHARYGTLDGAMMRYDTVSGEASYRNGAIPGQTILNPMHDARGKRLIAGTTYLADCSTATPIHDRTCAVVLDPRTMEVMRKIPGPEGVAALANLGPLDGERWLMRGENRLFVFDVQANTLTPFDQQPELPEGTLGIASAGAPGRFLIQVGESLQLWEIEAGTFTPMATWAKNFVGRWWVHGVDVTFDCGRFAALWRGALRRQDKRPETT